MNKPKKRTGPQKGMSLTKLHIASLAMLGRTNCLRAHAEFDPMSIKFCASYSSLALVLFSVYFSTTHTVYRIISLIRSPL